MRYRSDILTCDKYLNHGVWWHDDVIKWKHPPRYWSFVPGEFPAQRPVTRIFMFSLICALNKRLSKQSCGWWFETPSRPLWRHCNESCLSRIVYMRQPRISSVDITSILGVRYIIRLSSIIWKVCQTHTVFGKDIDMRIRIHLIMNNGLPPVSFRCLFW